MSGFCTSERAFGDYLTRESEKALLRIYRKMNFKRFHYSNAAMCVDDNYIDFYSYYTRVCRVNRPESTNGRISLCVYPFIYDANNFKNSPTTNKQMNKFLKEYIDADVSVFEIRRLYASMCNAVPTPTLTTYDGKVIHFEFSEYEYYISDCSIKKRLSDNAFRIF